MKLVPLIVAASISQPAMADSYIASIHPSPPPATRIAALELTIKGGYIVGVQRIPVDWSIKIDYSGFAHVEMQSNHGAGMLAEGRPLDVEIEVDYHPSDLYKATDFATAPKVTGTVTLYRPSTLETFDRPLNTVAIDLRKQ